MKNLILSLLCLMLAFSGWSQADLRSNWQYQPQQIFSSVQLKAASKQQKGPTTQVYYEDFDGALPAGWSIINNNCPWRWDTIYPSGALTTGVSAINSTTAANGFLVLPMDLCNTPVPPTGAVTMDETVSSPAIPIPQMGVVFVRFQQYMAYCCNVGNEVVLECSTDGLTWDTYSVKQGLNPNTGTPNAELQTVNVTSTLAGADTAYLRFRATGSTHYFWMLDDLEILEGDSISLDMTDFRMIFSRNHQFNPTYTIVPRNLMEPIEFEVDIFNDGAVSQTGVNAKVDVYHDSTFALGPGSGVVDVLNNTFNGSIPSQTDTTIVISNPPYINIRDGYIRAEATISSPAGVGSNPPQLFRRSFAVGDSVFARDDGGYGGTAGPSDYVGGGNDGDAWGVMYEMLGDSGVATSISVWVPNDPALVGVAISPRIWPFDDSQASIGAAIGNPIGQQPFSFSITNAMLGDWLVMPFLIPPSLQVDSQYIAGWEQITGAAQNLSFSTGRDVSTEAITPAVTNFCFLNEPGNSRWFWTPTIAAVRLNFGNHPSNTDFIVGLDKDQSEMNDFNLMPNPTDGMVNVQLNKGIKAKAEVRDPGGQIVYEEWSTRSGFLRFDLTKLDAGIYFVTIHNSNGIRTKKLIIY